MCKIRLFRTHNSNIFDNIVECRDIALNPIDRPAYVIYTPNNGEHCFGFIFSNDKEPKKPVKVNDIIIEYGINSGRVYIALSHVDVLNETDIFNIMNNVKANNEYYTERFIQNIRSYIAILKELLCYVINNPLQGEENLV